MLQDGKMGSEIRVGSSSVDSCKLPFLTQKTTNKLVLDPGLLLLLLLPLLSRKRYRTGKQARLCFGEFSVKIRDDLRSTREG